MSGDHVLGVINLYLCAGHFRNSDDDDFLLSFAKITAGVLTLDKTRNEKANLERQFRQSQKMEAMGQLAGGVSHDFNNLLSVINGYSQLLLTNTELKSDVISQVEEILRAGERAAGLTRQLLIFSRHQIVETKIIDLEAIISGMQKMLCRLIKENIMITRNTCPDIPILPTVRSWRSASISFPSHSTWTP